MSIPLYYLSVYPVPNSILDGINKAVSVFFWSKGGNRKDNNSISWDDITHNHTREREGFLFAILIYPKFH